MAQWGDGEMAKWGNGEMAQWGVQSAIIPFPPSPIPPFPPLLHSIPSAHPPDNVREPSPRPGVLGQQRAQVKGYVRGGILFHDLGDRRRQSGGGRCDGLLFDQSVFMRNTERVEEHAH